MLNPFPQVGARAIINAVYGFFQSFPPESWRVSPRPGPFARDRAPLSPQRPQPGQAPARCVMRHSGVEYCSSGVQVDGGHHTTLAPVVSTAKIVQEVTTGTDTVTQDPNPSVQLSPSANDTALTPHAAAGTALPPAASSRPRHPLFSSSNGSGPTRQSGRSSTRSGSPTTPADRTPSPAMRLPPGGLMT